MEQMPFAVHATGKVAGRRWLGEPWGPPSDMVIRLGFDPEEPAEVTFRVEPHQPWVFDRELLEYALDHPEEKSGDADVCVIYIVKTMEVRIILAPSDKQESVVVTIPVMVMRDFVEKMQEAVARGEVNYNIDLWLTEFE